MIIKTRKDIPLEFDFPDAADLQLGKSGLVELEAPFVLECESCGHIGNFLPKTVSLMNKDLRERGFTLPRCAKCQQIYALWGDAQTMEISFTPLGSKIKRGSNYTPPKKNRKKNKKRIKNK